MNPGRLSKQAEEKARGVDDPGAAWHGPRAAPRQLLFPNATDAEFADRYAQTVTFALLLARAEGIDLAGRDLDDVAVELGHHHHTLMGRALDVLTDRGVLKQLAVSRITTLQRVLSVVDWDQLPEATPSTAWLYFYEDFLESYDPVLRRATGSYYTPVEAVDPMVRLVEGPARRPPRPSQRLRVARRDRG